MNRIEELRRVALGRRTPLDEFHYRFFKRYSETGIVGEFDRYADAFYHMFATLTPNITDGELIVGECVSGLNDDERREWDDVYHKISYEECMRAGRGQDSHMAIDYPLLLSLGIKGIIKRIDRLLAVCALPFQS